MTPELLKALLAPISPERPSGMDAVHTPEFDEIRKLRKGDDPSLPLGSWERELRAPQWPKVRTLCEGVLKSQSKDLQVACWYVEALTRTEGMTGLAFGLAAVEGLISQFWETCFPLLDPSEPEERIAKLEWLNSQLPLVINSIPVCAPKAGGYSMAKWEESRFVENLGARDAAAKEEAIREGKLSGEAFDKAVSASGQGFYLNLNNQIQGALAAFNRLEHAVDQRFGLDAPGLEGIRDALEGCATLTVQILKRFGLDPGIEASAKAETVNLDAPTPINPPSMPGNASFNGPVQSRAEAIRRLREIAKYFRDNEPHSPVGPLAERAARWGEMPLDEWLSRVIKDEATLGQLRDLLDLRPEA